MTVIAPPSDAAGDDELSEKAALIANGECANFHGKTIDASWVRNLVIAPGAFGAVHIENATIAGRLNLRDVRASEGGACHALILKGCTLNPNARLAEPGIDASHAHLARLSLLDCRTTGVELTDAMIAGALELDGLRGPGETCWIKARGLRVAGALTARRAELTLPWVRRESWPPDEEYWRDIREPYALDLAGADIGGSLVLWPGFVAYGGVSLSGANVGEGLRAAGARLYAPEIGEFTSALFAQYVRVRGPVFLCTDDDEDEPFRARGGISFYGADIDGAMNCSGCVVGPRDDAAGRAALLMPAASISGDLHLLPQELSTVDLSNLTVGGNLTICSLSEHPVERIEATTCRVRGDVTLQGPISGADLSGSVIDGRLALGDAIAPLRLTGVNDIGAIRLTDVRVGRDLRVSPIETNAGFAVNVDWTRRPVHVRTIELDCYPGAGWRLAEALYRPTSGSGRVILAFLYRVRGGAAEVKALDGTSEPMHDIARDLDISTPERAQTFLAFFCAYLWGDEGPFILQPESSELERGNETETWHAAAQVEYSTAIFDATFSFRRDGTVEMMGDAPLRQLPLADLERRLFAKPFRLYRPARDAAERTIWPVPPVLEPRGRWRYCLADDLPDDVWVELATQRFNPQTVDDAPTGWPRPSIDLGGLRAASLDDADGRNWFDDDEIRPRVGRVTHGLVRVVGAREAADLEHRQPKLRLQLTGFEYDRVKQDPPAAQERRATVFGGHAEATAPAPRRSAVLRRAVAAISRSVASLLHPRTALERRLHMLGVSPDGAEPTTSRLHSRTAWIESQYSTYPPNENEFRPEPYEQLARVWRATGNLDDANSAIYEKLQMQVRLRPDPGWSAGRRRQFRIGRAWYGLLFVSGVAAAVVRPLRVFLIFGAVWWFGVAVLYVASDALKVTVSPVIPAVSTVHGQTEIVVPTSAVTGQPEEVTCGDRVSKIVYPLDLMIPFVDLGQESRCEFPLTSGWWGFAQGVYELIGWLLTAGVLLAFSGVVRRQFER